MDLLLAESTAEYQLTGVTLLFCCLLHAHRNGKRAPFPLPQRHLTSPKIHQQPAYYWQSKRPLKIVVYHFFCTSQSIDTIWNFWKWRGFLLRHCHQNNFLKLLVPETNMGFKIKRIVNILISSWEEGKFHFIPFGEYRLISFVF